MLTTAEKKELFTLAHKITREWLRYGDRTDYYRPVFAAVLKDLYADRHAYDRVRDVNAAWMPVYQKWQALAFEGKEYPECEFVLDCLRARRVYSSARIWGRGDIRRVYVTLANGESGYYQVQRHYYSQDVFIVNFFDKWRYVNGSLKVDDSDRGRALRREAEKISEDLTRYHEHFEKLFSLGPKYVVLQPLPAKAA